MSRYFQPKNKDLVKLEVVPHEKVWVKNKNSKGEYEYRFRKDIDIYGKVNKGFSSSVTSTNLKDKNHKFIDFHSLSKKTKNEITNLLMNKDKKVCYLIKKK